MPNTAVLQISDGVIKYGPAGDHKSWKTVPLEWIDHRNNLLDRRFLLSQQLKTILIEKLFLKIKDSKLLIIENVFETKDNRDIILSSLVHDLSITEVCFQPDIFMPILACGNTTGLVLQIGLKESKCMAIYEGRPILNTLKALSFGMQYVLDYLHTELSSLYPDITTTVDQNKLNTLLLKKLNQIQIHDGDITIADSTTESITITVPLSPNSFKTSTSPIKIIHIPIQLFMNAYKKLLYGNDNGCLSEIMIESMNQCNMSIRSAIISNIIICGYGSDIPGFHEDICKDILHIVEMKKGDNKSYHTLYTTLTHQSSSSSSSSSALSTNTTTTTTTTTDNMTTTTTSSFSTHIRLPYIYEDLVWIGGSIFASISSNQSKFLRSKEFKSYTLYYPLSATSSSQQSSNMDINNQIESIQSGTNDSVHVISVKTRKNNKSSSLIWYECPDWMSVHTQDWKFFAPIIK